MYIYAVHAMHVLTSLNHPTYAPCDTPFMTPTATCFDTEEPSLGIP